MTTPLANDPILAMVPEVRARRVLKPCVLYARLGRGGMGAVYLGKHLTLLQRQVVKCLWLMGSGNPSADGSLVERFQQEARLAAEMTHQNLVRVTHVDHLGELHYLVMEYIAGEDLDRRVQRAGPMTEQAALTALLGAAQGLGYAHARGVVHRDVKPANVMVASHGEVKVIDLGLARAIDSSRQLGATVGTLGTPLYMAPEQWEGADVGPTADVWALGAVLHFLLTGRSHVPAGTTEHSEIRRFVCAGPELDPADLGVKLSRGARRLLRRCMARDPGERFADARELAAELLELVPGDEQLLVDANGAPLVAGDEPDDDELRAIRETLLRGEQADATLPFQPLDQTLPMPGADRTLAMPGAAPARTPTPSPTSGPRPSRPLPRRRRTPWLPIAAATTALAVVGAAGVTFWPRVDYAALQQQAMAAIYQERFDDADALLRELEQAPAFADQARRLRIDGLAKDAARKATTQPVAALQRLADAAVIARTLLIQRDTDDALTRLAVARTPIEKALGATMAASLTVTSPQPGSVITRGRQTVRVHFAPGGLHLTASIQGHALAAASAGGDSGEWIGEWATPDSDGAAELTVVIEEPTTHLQQVVAVPVEVKRGAVALRLDAATGASRADTFELTGSVDNGPLAVRGIVTGPDGRREELALGNHDGEFRVVVPCRAGVDGDYTVRLVADAAGHDLTTPECTQHVDRTAPSLTCDTEVQRSSGQSLVLRGRASEPCRVAVAAHTLSVATEADGSFALPWTLPAADGELTLVLQARDAAGNDNLAAATIRIVVDRTPPTLVAEALQFEAATAATELTVRGRLDEPGQVAADNGPGAVTDDAGAFAVVTALPPGPIEQTVTVRLTARDRAGNAGTPRTVDVLVDRRGPTILPGAPDGSWWADGAWWLRVEDRSGPCRVQLGGETKDVGPDGLVKFVRRVDANGIVAIARDRLGNESTRAISGPGMVEVRALPAPGPSWGEPVGDGVDAQLHLHERVAIAVGDQRLVLRLVRPLRDDELPPVAFRDPRATALLQGQAPFYLAETELPVAVWAAWQAMPDADPSGGGGYRFDPATCRWSQSPDADWRTPLHPSLADDTPADARAHWPVTQVTPAAANAFCEHFGLRLPTANEWQFVARMGCRNRYGWMPHGALEQRANLADLALKARAPQLAAFDTVDDGFATLAPVDAFPRAGQEHPWGFRGLLGNVAEWCSTGNGRVEALGGSWLSEPRELRVDDVNRDRAITSGAWDHVGFRVARDL